MLCVICVAYTGSERLISSLVQKLAPRPNEEEEWYGRGPGGYDGRRQGWDDNSIRSGRDFLSRLAGEPPTDVEAAYSALCRRREAMEEYDHEGV